MRASRTRAAHVWAEGGPPHRKSAVEQTHLRKFGFVTVAEESGNHPGLCLLGNAHSWELKGSEQGGVGHGLGAHGRKLVLPPGIQGKAGNLG